MSPSDSPDHPGSILYHLESSDVPLFHKPVTGQDFFFAVSYSKLALVEIFNGKVRRSRNRKNNRGNSDSSDFHTCL